MLLKGAFDLPIDGVLYVYTQWLIQMQSVYISCPAKTKL